MEKTYAVIVVTYNRKELLKENIECLLAQRSVIPHIIIIDNHSTDGTKEYIADYIAEEKIEYCDTGSNLGGAGGFSFGIKYAAEKNYDYIWVMDDDCMPTENALEEFIKADKELKGQYGFLSSKVLWKDGSICTMNLQRKTLTKNLESFDNNLNQVVMASFVSLFLKREIVVEMGLPIKEFFIWTDDWEYTRRISLSADRLDRFNYLYRNDVYLYRREGIKGFCYEAARLTGHCIRVLIKSKDNKGKRLAKIYKGTISGLKFKPEIEYIT